MLGQAGRVDLAAQLGDAGTRSLAHGVVVSLALRQVKLNLERRNGTGMRGTLAAASASGAGRPSAAASAPAAWASHRFVNVALDHLAPLVTKEQLPRLLGVDADPLCDVVAAHKKAGVACGCAGKTGGGRTLVTTLVWAQRLLTG